MKKKVLVVDLDGTLYKINTFHYFVRHLIRHSIINFNVKLYIKILILFFLRGLNIVSHSKWKYYILKSIKNNTNIDFNNFVNSISKWKRDILILNDRKFDLKILATAAPSCYANIIADNELLDVCLGTDFPTSIYSEEFENCKEIKKENTLKYLLNKNILEIDTLITDHIDDLPLMKLAKNNIVVNPDRNMKMELKNLEIKFDVLS